MREQNEHVRALASGKGVDGRAARIAGCCTDDCRTLAALGQNIIHQAGQQLHGHVLEGQRRAVEEFQHIIVGANLHEGRNSRMPEGGIGLVDHGFQGVSWNFIAGEMRKNCEGYILIAFASQVADFLFGKLWPGSRQIKAAVAGKTCQQGIAKTKSGRITTCRDILQDRIPEHNPKDAGETGMVGKRRFHYRHLAWFASNSSATGKIQLQCQSIFPLGAGIDHQNLP